MKALFENNSSFFAINSEDFVGLSRSGKSAVSLIDKEVLSLSITEEMGKITTGTLSMKDNGNVFSRVFTNGKKFDLSWGYKNYDKNISLIPEKILNKDEAVGVGDRQGLQCIIQAPSGSFAQNGNTGFNVTFYGNEILSVKSRAVFNKGTYSQMIKQVFLSLDVSETYIDFEKGNTQLNTNNAKRQWETSFKFLLRLSYEWRTFFHIGYKRNGSKVGMFIDPQKMDSAGVQKFLKGVTGVSGGQRSLYFNDGGVSNVMSGNWKQNIGEGGQGDGATISYINGQAVIQKFVAETQKVVFYKLNTQKIKDKFKNRSIADQTTLVKQFMQTKNFDEVKWAFDPIESSTAPQGMGFDINLKMKGDPFLTPPMRAIFKGNFPVHLTQDQQPGSLIRFYVQKVIHTIDRYGYFCYVKIQDTYASSGLLSNAQGFGF